MIKPHSELELFTAIRILVAIVLAFFFMLPPSVAISQTINHIPEQGIFVAPLTSAQASITNQIDENILLICKNAQTGTGTLSEECNNMFVRIIENYGKSVVAMNESVAQLRSQSVEFSSKNQEHIMRTLEAQKERGVYLFWLAILVVVMGIIASALQFLKAWKQETVTDIEISISEKQLSVKTSWIGVILLGMSMAFFGLYLVFVYTIAPI